MAAKGDLSNLTSQMSGKDTLNGWDVLVSYDQDILNSVLRERAQRIGLLKPLSWTSSYTDGYEEEVKNVAVNIQLWNPVFQFVGTDAVIKLTFSISGSYQYDGQQPKCIPDRSVLVITTSLFNVTGNCGPDPQSELADPGLRNRVVLMDANADAAKDISIVFRDCSANITVAPGGKRSSGNPIFTNSIARELIIQHFQESGGLKYCLASVDDRHYPTSSSSEVLIPTSFCFTVFTRDAANNTPGTVCMWVALKGGWGNGMRPSEQTPLEFTPTLNQSDMNPIPSGCTASIIFSHYTMANLFLKLAFSHASKNVKCTSAIGNPGITFSLNLPSVTTTRISDQRISNGTYSVSGVNLGSPCSTIVVSDTTSNNSVSVSYSSDNQEILFTQDVNRWDNEYDNSTTAIFHLSATAQWQASSHISNPCELGLSFCFPTTLKTVPQQGQSYVHNYQSYGRNNNLKEFLKSMWSQLNPLPVPAIDMKFRPLDYSTITNLIFPGQELFLPNCPVPNDNTSSAGLACPRDTILTGTIKKITTSTTAGNAGTNGILDWHQPGTIDAFKEDLFVAKKILGTLTMTASSKGDDTHKQVKELLECSGYGGLAAHDFLGLLNLSMDTILTADDFLGLLNLSMDTVLPEPKASGTSTTGGTLVVQDETSSGIDIRIFSGIYEVESPASAKGNLLIIYPRTVTISYDGVNATPQETLDETGQSAFWWSVEGRLYTIIMTAYVDPDTHIVTASFQGTIDDQPFSGVLANLQASGFSGSVESLLGTRQAALDNLINFGFAFPVLIGYIATNLCRVGGQELAHATQHYIQRSIARLNLALVTVARASIQEAILQHEIGLREDPEQLNTDMISGVDEVIKGIKKDEIDTFTTAALDRDPWRTRLGEAREAAIAKIRSHVHELAGPKIDSDLHVWKDFFDNDAFCEVKGKILEPIVEHEVLHLDASVSEGRGYITGAITAQVLKAKAKNRTEALARLKEEHDRKREMIEAEMRQAEIDGRDAENWVRKKVFESE